MLILASASKARLELLESVGIKPDKILNTNIDETPKKSEKPLDYVSRIALEKNKSVKEKKVEIVLTAENQFRARQMCEACAGPPHVCGRSVA